LHHVVVDLLVEQVSSVVFQRVFDADDYEDHQQRNHGDLLLKGLHDRNPVEQRQEQEVNVSCPEKTREANTITRNARTRCDGAGGSRVQPGPD